MQFNSQKCKVMETAKEISAKFTLNDLWELERNEDKRIFWDITEQQAKEALKIKEQKVFKAPYFVTMNDKFMSGWGLADNKTNKLIIACESYEQARAIERNAQKRNEMKYVNICSNKPQIKKNVYPSWKHYEDMGEIWTK